MEGRYYGGLALLIGIASVGGLAFLSYRREHDDLALRIRSQRPIPAAHGAPASIRVDFDPSRALRKVGQDGNVEYRVVDSEGRLYATSTSADEKKHSLSIPLGYGRRVQNPTLEMLVDGEPTASVRLAPLPEPKTRLLPAQRSDLVRAFIPLEGDVTALRNGPTYGPRWVDLNIQPRRPLPNGEFWEVTVLQTTLNDGAQGTFSTGQLHEAAEIPLLYGDDVTAVKVRVARHVPRSRSERVAITGLRLVRQDGQTRVEWRNAHVVNHLGLTMRLSPPSHPYEVYGPRDAAGDYRAPVVELRISPIPGAFKANERIDPPIVQEDSSVPKSLHLQSLTVIPKATGFYVAKGAIGGGVGAPGLPPPLVGGHPVLNKPFTLYVKIDLRSDEPLGDFEATIPVESAPSR